MQLIGMLDSPYVRRVAVSLNLMGIPFEHRSISVFRTFEQFKSINPVVKAPSLVCDDGEVLMDSTLILDYAEAIGTAKRSLVSADIKTRQHDLRVIGLALAACEKSVQIVYEHELRPAEKMHAPWLDRVTGQLHSAYALLEQELQRRPLDRSSERMSQAGVATAVAWQFTHMLLPGVVDVAKHPALQAFSAAAEQLPEFLAAPPK
jgi:glutathione S-transferase